MERSNIPLNARSTRRPKALTPPLAASFVHQVQYAQSNPWEFVRKGFALAAVTQNNELLRPATNDRSTRFVEIDISDSPNLR